MDTLDGFILNLFRTGNPQLDISDFQKNDVWVCDLLNQDSELAKEFIKYKLSLCATRMEKLQFLYSSRACFKITVDELTKELDPNFNSEFGWYRQNYSLEQMGERLDRYQKALAMSEQAICYYIDCSKLDCKDKANSALDFSNSQIVLIFYYFLKHCGLEPRTNIDISPIAKFIHLITGKDFTGVANSDFYKKLLSVPNFKSDKELITDLETIKPLFTQVELNDIVKMIDNEIEMARNQIKKGKKQKI